jgi:RHS repeat-associated protein
MNISTRVALVTAQPRNEQSALRLTSRTLCLTLTSLLSIIVSFCSLLQAQTTVVNSGIQDYLTGNGRSFAAPYPAEMGTVDAASGNLHLEIPIGTLPQRAKSAPLISKLVYDSRIWVPQYDSTSNSEVWTVLGLGEGVSAPLAYGTWGFEAGTSTVLQATGDRYTISNGQVTSCETDYILWDTSGSERYFPIVNTDPVNCPFGNGSGYAADSSGYYLVRNNASNILNVYAPDGTLVFNYWVGYCEGFYPQICATPYTVVEDSNGNYLYSNNGIETDTLGRVLGTAVFNSQDTTTGTSNYTVNTTTIPVSTNFQQTGITECNSNCTVEVIQSIILPDNTSKYTFFYDCNSASGNSACNSPSGQSGYYGTLTSMTLPTGQTITYGYSNFKDAAGNTNRWLTSKTTGSANWSYSPTVTANGGWKTSYSCATGASVDGCQTTTVTRPDGSKEVTTFAFDNGAWPSTIQSYDTNGVTLLSQTNTSWDFSNPCTLAICYTSSGQENGAQYIRKMSTLTTVPVPGGSITKKTSYGYDSPQTGNIASIQEWAFRTGTQSTAVFPTLPDRATYTKYASIGTNNNINRPTAITICNNNGGSDSNCPGGGIAVARTTVMYDAYGSNNSLALTNVPTAVNHDDTNFGTSWTTRGNPTQISRLVSGSTYLTTYLSYDTTGQVVQVLDPSLNKTTYSYADKFYYDNGANPPSTYTPSTTNAYVTQVTDTIGTTSMGYYYGSGKLALATDYNTVTTYSHYIDPFDRPTETIYPIGWTLNTYTSPTQSDSYSAVGDTAATTACVSCTHLQALLDQLGRPVTGNLVNNPVGQVSVTSGYDSLNRVVSSGHPHIGSNDPSNVSEAEYYDGLGRLLETRHPDGEGVRSAYGAYVGNLGGLASQQSSTTTYGVGYPVISVDEAGKQRQQWIDGFGRVIEVDEPGSTTATVATATITISGSSGGTSGSITVTVNGFAATASWISCSTAASVAASLGKALSAPQSPVTAAVTGTTVTMAAVGFAPSFVVSYNNTNFQASPASGTLNGGTGGILSSTVFTAYSYDILGNLTGVTQGSQTRSYHYDGLSRLTQETTPEAGTVTLSYTMTSGAACSGNPSNPCTKTAPLPNQSTGTVSTTYTYNAANQLTQKTHSDTTGTETYTYGTSASAFNIGRLASMTDPSGSESYTYDSMGDVLKLSKTIGSKTYATSYAYNSGGQLTQITYPSGRNVQYSYDNVGHLCLVAAATTNCSSSTTPYLTLPSGNYDAAGRPLSAIYGNGIVATASYSPLRSQLTSIRYANGSTPLFGLIYYYLNNATTCPSGSSVGNNGEIQCISDFVQPGRSSSYTYDPLGRLSTAKTTGSTPYPAWGLSFVYDRYGNRTAQNVTAGSGYTSLLTINPVNNQITSPAYTYDGAGNVIAEPPTPASSYTYDGEECNTGYSGVGGTATYTCDGNHLRVQKVITNGATTVYVRSGGQVVAEYDNGAPVTSPTREYIYGNHLLAIVTGSSGGSGGTILYQHRDHLAPRLFTDVNGNDVAEQGTYPYGESWYSNSATSNWVFTTYERDAESGDDDALARSYAGGNGRFLSPDPLQGEVGDPQSWNRYAYVENDPIDLTDPSGQGFWGDLAAFFEDIGSLLSGGWSSSDLTNALGCPDCGGTDIDLIYGGAQVSPQFSGGLGAEAASMGNGWGAMQGWGGSIGHFAGQQLQTFNTVLYLGVTGIYDTVFAGPLNMLKSASDNICGSDGGACAIVPGVGFEVAATEEVEEGYTTFQAFKNAYGPAGEGMEWHHIVGQTPGNIAQFGPRAIHTIGNMIPVAEKIHRGKDSISALYSSKQAFADGMIVREWLASQSFEAQRQFGLQVLQDFGVIP